jgi:glycosyltransferase involved in cell wall biosynthesis
MNDKFNSFPIISVIVPTYNRANILCETLDSILCQTYENFELIVVDDGSTDNTEEVVKKYNDLRLHYIKTENWGGPARPRNIGIQISKGEYIAFCDDDDLWLPHKLESQIKLFCCDNNVGLVYSKCYMLRENKIYRKAPKMNLYNGYVFHKMIFITNVPILTAIVDKKVFKKIGFFDEDKKIIALEDMNLWIRLAKEYRVISSNKPTAIYREHSENMSTNDNLIFRKAYLYRKLYKSKIITLFQLLFIALPGIIVTYLHKVFKQLYAYAKKNKN